ncbi:ribonuclease H-like domain-containing protein [Tanacetum coccineum]|uniref:Ribonuclease H-like domain-containing protein n=1 Tax=Tanacetum coccineum TaxID=301880 RepID=A0ABQ5EBG7_9ASTR
MFPFKTDTASIVSSDTSQELNHSNFFYNLSDEIPDTPYDEERVTNTPNGEGSNSSQDGSLTIDQSENEGQPVRRSERSSVFPNKYNEFVVDSKEASKDVEAMNKEMDALHRNDTWDITELLKDRNSIVYVDDIIVTGNNAYEIEIFKGILKTKFQIKDLGKLKYFLGIKVLETDQGLCLSQRKYCLDLLSDFRKLACKPSTISLEQNLSITNELTELDNVSDFCKKPLRSHLKIALKVLRNLKPILVELFILSSNPKASLEAFVDDNWAKCLVTWKSVTGFCIKLNGSLVS